MVSFLNFLFPLFVYYDDSTLYCKYIQKYITFLNIDYLN
nr:MAG TPA: hypothetical protein [Caudoviricetes sp.]